MMLSLALKHRPSIQKSSVLTTNNTPPYPPAYPVIPSLWIYMWALLLLKFCKLFWGLICLRKDNYENYQLLLPVIFNHFMNFKKGKCPGYSHMARFFSHLKPLPRFLKKIAVIFWHDSVHLITHNIKYSTFCNMRRCTLSVKNKANCSWRAAMVCIEFSSALTLGKMSWLLCVLNTEPILS